MQKIATLLVFMLLTGFCYSQKNATAAAPEALKMKETSYDFGMIPQNKPVYHQFEIINTTKEPLQLSAVTAPCGCTTPEWSREPIAPGASAFIKVGYNAAAEGAFEKPVNIVYNGDKTITFTVKGNVWRAPSGSAPANASIQFLKQLNQ